MNELVLPHFARRLPIRDGQLHFLKPAGVGDMLWDWSKLYAVAQKRNVTFWFPEAEQQRSAGLGAMLGFRCGYLPGLSSDWVWAQKGDPEMPDSGAVLPVHSNKHLNTGVHIDRWYPQIPFKNPCDDMRINTAVYKLEVGAPRYAVVFMCHEGYMEGNLLPGAWARIIKHIEDTVAPVLIVAAAKDVPFAMKVCDLWYPTIAPVFDAPLEQVALILSRAVATFGIASGITILSTYLGTPTLQAYPYWLSKMPGSWEDNRAVWGACFVDELEDKVKSGNWFDGAKSAPIMAQFIDKPLRVIEPPEYAKEKDVEVSTHSGNAMGNGRSPLGVADLEIPPYQVRDDLPRNALASDVLGVSVD